MKKLFLILNFLLFCLISYSKTEYSTYQGTTKIHQVEKDEPTSIKFEVDKIDRRKNTTWYVNGVENTTAQDWSGDSWVTGGIDPDYTVYCNYGSTKVQANVYDDNWNWEETHTWNVTVNEVKPDLIVENATLSTTTVNQGETLTVSCRITNQGTAKADFARTELQGLYYYLSKNTTYNSYDIKFSTSNINDISAGAYTTVSKKSLTIPTSTSEGTYYILFYIDKEDDIVESNENNNVLYEKITVKAPRPDLIVENATLSTTTVNQGESLTVSCRITNQGTAKADFARTELQGLYYYLSKNTTYNSYDIKLSTSNINDISAGAYTTVSKKSLTIPTSTSEGTYYILFYIDKEDDIVESNESNNVSYKKITVKAPKPDLVVENASLSVTTVNQGDNLSVSCRISNQGIAKANFALTELQGLYYYLSINTTYDSDDIKLSASNINDISAGAYTTVSNKSLTIPSSTSAGTYYILFYIDKENNIIESNESNNVSYKKITVKPYKPDLVVENPSLSVTTVNQGDNLSVSCRISNQGTAKANFALTELQGLYYYLSINTTYDSDDIKLSTSNINDITAGSYTTVSNKRLTIPSSTTAGTYYILFYIDKENNIIESNESNNVSYKKITVKAPKPDLIVENPSLSVTTVNQGDNLSVSCRISNQGTAKANFALTELQGLYYYLSINTTYDSDDIKLSTSNINDITAGSYTTVSNKRLTIPSSTTEGCYYILFYVDKEDDIVESNESNNVSYKEITVKAPKPDLIVENATLSTTTVNQGESLTVSCRISNQGTAKADFAYNELQGLYYYLSTNMTYDSNDIKLSTSNINDISAGAYTTVSNKSLTIPSLTTEGKYYILFYVDKEDDIVESNEINNIKYTSIQIDDSRNILSAIWLNSDLQEIEDTELSACETVWLKIETEGYASGTKFDLVIKEGNWLTSNDYIATVKIQIGENGVGYGTWNTVYSYKTIDENVEKSAIIGLPDFDRHPDYFFEVQNTSDQEVLKKSGYIEVVDRANPDAPKLLTPENNLVSNISDNDSTFLFKWEMDSYPECRADIKDYYIQIATDASFLDKIENDVLSMSSFECTLNWGTYYWRVAARNVVGIPEDWNEAAWSEVRVLEIQSPKKDVVIISEHNEDSLLGHKKPLLLIHGWQVQGGYGGGIWNNFKKVFDNSSTELNGKYKLYEVQYLSNLISVEALGDSLKKCIDRLGLKNVSIVAHSMGGLVARSFMDSDFGGDKGGELVDLLITLGTPHHGSPAANGLIRSTVLPWYNFLDELDIAYFMVNSGSPSYYQHNRSDMLWDNFDNLYLGISYVLYRNEENLWLKELNSKTEFDDIILTYSSVWLGFNHPEDKLGSYLLGRDLMLEMGVFTSNPGIRNNDGIVPYSSARFEGHTKTKGNKSFTGYNHTRIATGNREDADTLFTVLTNDLLGNAIPSIALTPSVAVDFGELAVTESKMKTVKIKNTGTSALSISNIYIDGNDDDQFKLEEVIQPFVLSIGEVKDVEVVFEPLSAGYKSSLLRVKNNAEDLWSLADVSLSGLATEESLASLEFSPSYSMDFGTTMVGEPLRERITISSNGNVEAMIESLTIEGENFDDFSIISPSATSFTVHSGATQELVVQFNPKSEGSKSAILKIYNNSNNAGPIKEIELKGGTSLDGTILIKTVPDYHYSFCNVKIGKELDEKFRIFSEGTDVLSCTNISITGVSSESFEIINLYNKSTGIQPGGVLEFAVRFKPDSEGEKIAQIEILNNSDNSGPKKVIYLNGEGTDSNPKTLMIEPAPSFDFGDVTIGSTINKEVVFTNTCDDIISVSNIYMDGDDSNEFEVDRTSFAIAAHNTEKVLLTFKPTSEGAKSAALVIDNNSDNISHKVISTTGNCVSVPVCKVLISPDLSMLFTAQENSEVEKTVTIENIGSMDVTVSQLKLEGDDASQFEISNLISLPYTILINEKLEIPIKFKPTDTGMKTCFVVITNDCMSLPVKKIQLMGYIDATSLEQIDSKNINIYPNPTSSILTIDADKPYSIEVVSLSGNLLLKEEMIYNKYDIDLSSLNAGVYLLRFFDKDNVFVKYVTKQ